MKNLNEERLALAWARANQYQWDEEVFGPRPAGYDRMDLENKVAYLHPKMQIITMLIGDAGTSRAWWKYGLHKPEREWRKWYFDAQCPHLFIGHRFPAMGLATVENLLRE